MVSIAMGSSNPSVTFSYDELGRRVKKTVTQPNRGGNATTTYLWCGQTLCMAQYGGGATRRYVAEGEVYTSGGTTTPYYYGPDQLGSVRDVFNATSGALLAHYDYDAYGLGTGVAYGTVTGTSKLTNFGYAGMLYESTSGISLANYRAYDPQTARWMSRDPIGEEGGINLYEYVGGSPISFRDPSGLCPPGTHAANPDEVQNIINSAQQIATQGLRHGNGPGKIMCDQYVERAINQAYPGAWQNFNNEPQIANDQGSIQPDVNGPQVGDLATLGDPGHVVIVTGVNNGGVSQFIGSQNSTGPATVNLPNLYWTPKFGQPGNASYFNICLPN